jgi:ArsR family transcriptional regulator
MKTKTSLAQVRPLAPLSKCLGDETRLRIVALLSCGELCVCHLESALGLSQPNVSRHLRILRSARLVDQRRNGNWMFYRLAPQEDEGCHRLLGALISTFGKQARLRRDLERLKKSKGPKACS